MKFLHYSDKSDSQFLNLYDQADILVSCGDLTLFDFAGLDTVPVKKPAVGVYGNHDSGQYLEELGIINLHWKIYEWGGLTWGGFQSCLRYKPHGIQFTETEAEDFTQRFPRVDILLLHAGPKDMLDDPSDDVHIGSEAIAQYVTDRQPKFVFCGHQYSNAEMTIGSTKIIRTYGARLIDL